MKKFSLLILSILLLSCSSDNNDEIVDPVGNFLDVYNGVIWADNNNDGSVVGADDWYIFKSESLEWIEYVSNVFGCESEVYKWGVECQCESGGKFNIKENSKNLLKIEYIDSDPNDNYLMTITASENGNTINIIFSDDSNNSYTYNKVSEGCK